jgi:hypothetical protein
MDSNAFKFSDPNSPWLTPMGPLVLRGGLRGMVSQYSDGVTNLLTPKRVPMRRKTDFTYVSFPIET